MTDAEISVRDVVQRDQSGAWFATSPDLPGFEAVGPDRKDLLERLVPKYMADLFAASGCPMVVAAYRHTPCSDGRTYVVLTTSSR